MKKQVQITIISIIAGILILSCSLTSNFPGLEKNVPTSTPIAIVVPDQIIVEPTIVINSDSVTITFSEADVLSWIQQYQSPDSGMTLSEPNVKLDDGIAQISGKVVSGSISGDILIQFLVSVDANGTPIVTINTMRIGEMDLPEAIRNQFSVTINQSISTSMANELGGRKIQSITIDNGVMSIQTTI